MHGTAKNPYSKELVQKYAIRQMEDPSEQQQKSQFYSPPKTAKAPPKKNPVILSSNDKTSSKAPELSDNRIDVNGENSSSTSAASSSGSRGNGNNNTKLIFGRFFLSMRIALGVFS